jgi:ribonuclease E
MDRIVVSKEMLINVSEGEECRIALLENGRLEELYMERASSTSHVGNIYKGKVTNVEPAIQAAFVDFGLGRNGFLHISDLLPTYFGKRGEDMQESVGRKLARRDRPPIQRCLRRGDEITVQIIKEGIGTKGPTLSTYLSIPGRILVMMPGMENFGVSRKIEDDKERRRLRKILDELDPIDGVGFIVRTAGMGKSQAEIEKDLKYLTRLWQTMEKNRKTHKAPLELYTEGDLVTRTVRDVYGSDIDRIVIDSKDVARRVKEFIKLTGGRTKTKVELYDEPTPLFHTYGIEKEIELIHSRHVPLPSGGSLVIDSTEAIVAIDVNSGKFREHADAETTAFRTDMEAADEIPRQLKLRDLGGVIICDFIDLRFERHRRTLEQRLFDNFKQDKAKTRILRMSEFGIIEITRQRMRPSLKRSIYSDCPHCRGAGLVKTPESMALDVMRKLAIAVHDDRVVRAELGVSADVAFYLSNKRRKALAELEDHTGKSVTIEPEEGLALDDLKLELYDSRDGRVYIDALGMVPEKDERGHRGRDRRRRNERPKPEPIRALQEIDEGDEEQDSDGGRNQGGDRGRGDRDRGDRARGDRASGERDRGDRDRGGRDRDDRGQRGDSSRDGRREGRRDEAYDDRRDNRREGRRDDGRRDDRGDGRRDAPREDRGRREPPRPFDSVRPVGMELARGGDGYRGPRVVELPDDAGGAESGHSGEDDGAEGSGEGQAGGEIRYDENGNPLPGEGGRRRRRRRRGGRGRRRNRDGQEGSFNEQGEPIGDNAGGTADEYHDDEAGEASAQDGATEAAVDDRDDSTDEIGLAPSAMGDEPESPEAVSAGEDAAIGDAAGAVMSGASEETGSVESVPAEVEAVDEAEETPVARRARRGERGGRARRGRGKSKASDETDAPAEMPATEAESAPSEESAGLTEVAADESDEAKPAKRRTRKARGTRTTRSKKDADKDDGDAKPASSSRAAASAQRVPPAGGEGRKSAVPPAINIVRTGSADKHLADDEPVDPQPLRRPRSYRDLDAIPDDLD